MPKIAALARRSEPKILWQGPFKQLSNTAVEAGFADQRTYVYKGQSVDQTMISIAAALAQVSDAGRQADLAQDLLGKGGVKLLGILRDLQTSGGGMDDLVARMKEAGLVMGGESIEVLDRAGDAWTRLGTRIKTVSGNFLAMAMDDSVRLKQLKELGYELDAQGNAVKIVAKGVEQHTAVVKENISALDMVKNRIHQLTNEALAPLSAAQREQINELVRWGVNEKEVAELVGTTTAAVHLQVQAQTEKVAASKKAAAEAEKAAKIEALGIQEVAKLWNEYDALRVKHGGTATDAQIADIDRWAADLTAKAVKAGTDTREFYDALAALSREKTEAAMLDWGALSSSSRSHLQDVADKAMATFEYAASHSSDFTRETIQGFRETAEAARYAANGWGEAFGEALDATTEKAKAAEEALKKTAKAAEEAARERSKGNTIEYDLSTETGFNKFMELNPGATVNVGMDYFTSHTLAEAIAAGLVTLPHLAAGAINFSGGKAVVGERGPEVVELPRGSNVIPGGGGLGGATQVTVAPGAIVFQYPIMNDQRSRSAVAGLVIDELYAKLRREGLRVPAGSRG